MRYGDYAVVSLTHFPVLGLCPSSEFLQTMDEVQKLKKKNIVSVSGTPLSVPCSVVFYGLCNRGIVFRFRARARFFSFLQNVPPTIFTVGVKRHTPPCNGDVKNTWNCASTSLGICLRRVQPQLTFTFSTTRDVAE